MKIAILLAALLCAPAVAHADAPEPLAQIIREQLAGWVPVGLGIAEVHVPGSLDQQPVDPATVTVEVPRELRAGRPSVKVTVGKRHGIFIPVTIARLIDVAVAQHALAAGAVITAADLAFEQRAVALADAAPPAVVVGAKVTVAIAKGDVLVNHDIALAPPLARGTQVAIELRRGSVVVKGVGLLEMPARPGTAASARLAATKTVVHGTLVAPATLVVE